MSLLERLTSISHNRLLYPDGGDGGGSDGGDGGSDGGAGTESQLGEAGKQALVAERQKAREAERAAKAAKAEADQFRQRLEELEAASKSEHEKALDSARKEASKEARQQVMSEVNARILKAELRAAAAGKLADPEDAIRLLDLDEFKVTDDGEVDAGAISKAIDSLLKEKPYLAGTKKPSGDADGGKKSSTDKPEVKPGIDRMRAAYASSSKT